MGKMVTLYKGVKVSDLKHSFIPGTMTTDISEALLWKERLESRKSKGIHRNIAHGKSVIISTNIDDEDILSEKEFQRAGVAEHDRQNCWTSQAKTKAQINIPIIYTVLDSRQIENLLYK